MILKHQELSLPIYLTYFEYYKINVNVNAYVNGSLGEKD